MNTVSRVLRPQAASVVIGLIALVFSQLVVHESGIPAGGLAEEIRGAPIPFIVVAQKYWPCGLATPCNDVEPRYIELGALALDAGFWYVAACLLTLALNDSPYSVLAADAPASESRAAVKQA